MDEEEWGGLGRFRGGNLPRLQMFVDEVFTSLGLGRVQWISFSDLWNKILVEFDGMVGWLGWRELAVFRFIKNVLVVFEGRRKVDFWFSKVLCNFGGQREFPDDGGRFWAVSFLPPLSYLYVWVHSEVTDQVSLG